MDQDVNPDPALHSFLRIIVRHLLKLEHQQKGFEKTYGWPFPRVDRICAIPYGSDLDQTRQNFKEKVNDNDKIGPGITQFLFHPSDDDPELENASPETANKRIDIDRLLFDRNSRRLHAGSGRPPHVPEVHGPGRQLAQAPERYDHIVRDGNCSAPPGDTDPYVHPVGCP